jgi:peptide deformylase
MSVLKVLTYPDPFLRRRMAPVTDVDDKVRRIITDMTETMYDEPGVGLAASQVGIDQRIIVYDVSGADASPQPRALINPEIVGTEGEQVSENEGCLSVPDFRADVHRAWRVEVTGMDPDGRSVRIEAEGFPAIVLQHEIDHLDGILFIDRISRLKRELYKRRVQKQLKQSA